MKSIKVDLSERFESVELHIFADEHIGDENHDMEHTKRRIETVEGKDNAFAILNGDIMNTALKSSVSDVYAETLSPQDQYELVAGLFKPIAKKILGGDGGNHEDRVLKNDGIDVMKLLARELEFPYSNEGLLLFLSLGRDTRSTHHNRKVTYTVYFTHGSGGGRKIGSKAARLSDLSDIVDADVYIHSHTHLPMVFKERYYRTNVQRASCTPVTRLFVNTASSLDYGGYGQKQGYSPASKDYPVIVLDGRWRDIKAIL